MITLTMEERKKFAEWLRQEVTTDKILLKQMSLISLPPAFLNRKVKDIDAAEWIAHKLLDVEEQTLGG